LHAALHVVCGVLAGRREKVKRALISRAGSSRPSASGRGRNLITLMIRIGCRLAMAFQPVCRALGTPHVARRRPSARLLASHSRRLHSNQRGGRLSTGRPDDDGDDDVDDEAAGVAARRPPANSLSSPPAGRLGCGPPSRGRRRRQGGRARHGHEPVGVRVGSAPGRRRECILLLPNGADGPPLWPAADQIVADTLNIAPLATTTAAATGKERAATPPRLPSLGVAASLCAPGPACRLHLAPAGRASQFVVHGGRRDAITLSGRRRRRPN
jgi:hypothetical protein